MSVLNILEPLLLGVVLGACLSYYLLLRRGKSELKVTSAKLNELESSLKVKASELTMLGEQKNITEERYESSERRVLNLEKEVSSVNSDKENLLSQVEKLESIEKSLENKLEALLMKVYDQSHERLTKSSKELWGHMINPFKGEIDELKKTVIENYEKESRESLSLKAQIENMNGIYEKMNSYTDSLTKALEGDSKVQGDWGEMILERILEMTGLTEGREYVLQGKGLGLKDDDGTIRKPDVILLLPQERNLIIDSKVSLVGYNKFFSVEDEQGRKEAGEGMLESIHRHIDDLSRKDYGSLYKLNSPDYVLMFVPNDGMFALATSLDRDIYNKAISKGVNLVSPSFLIPSLRLIQNIWQREKQTKNALKIAEEAGRLYDKFVSFRDDLQRVREGLGRADTAVDDAFKKLDTGNGSLVKKASLLKELGAKTKKELI